MQLPDAKIEQAASQEESRYTLKAVKLDVEGKRLMATDGHILAILPVEVSDQDHSALIPADVFKSMRAMQKRNKSGARNAKEIPINVTVNGAVKVTSLNESAEYETTTGQFPNADMVIPKVATDAPCTICLNIDLLLRLADALKAKDSQGRIAQLWIKDQNSAVLVKVYGSDGTGVIMPCRP